MARYTFDRASGTVVDHATAACSGTQLPSRIVVARTAIDVNGQPADHATAERARDRTAALVRAANAVEAMREALREITDDYAKAMKDAGVSHYPEALAIVRKARAALARAGGE